MAGALLWLAGTFVAITAVNDSDAAEAPASAHGSADVFAAPGIAMAWAILRGATEASTLVVVRLAVDRTMFGSVSVVGIDPFTQREQSVLPPRSTTPPIDVRVPRPQFADFPRTEFRLFASATAAPGEAPKLVVFYLGVPDTTPELASEAALETYLAGRIAGARDGTGRKSPP